MGVAISMLLSLVALTLFALANARHHRQLVGRLPSPRAVRACRAVATLLIVAAPFPWIAQSSTAIALVTWLFCGLPLAGVVVVAMFTALGGKAQP